MKILFSCTYPECRKSYVSNSILKRHVQAFHLSTKRFQCQHCEKCLASHQNLKEHLYIHTGEKPYNCPFPGCFASFRQGTHLSAHKKFEHPDNPTEPSVQQKTDIKAPIQSSIGMTLNNKKLEEAYHCNQKELILPLITSPYICKLPSIFSSYQERELMVINSNK